MQDKIVCVIEGLFKKNRYEYGWGKWQDGPRDFYNSIANADFKELVRTSGKVALGESTSQNIGQFRKKVLIYSKNNDLGTYDKIRVDNLNCICYQELTKIQKLDKCEDSDDYDLKDAQHRLEKAYVEYKNKEDIYEANIEDFNMSILIKYRTKLVDCFDKYTIIHKQYLLNRRTVLPPTVKPVAKKVIVKPKKVPTIWERFCGCF